MLQPRLQGMKHLLIALLAPVLAFSMSFSAPVADQSEAWADEVSLTAGGMPSELLLGVFTNSAADQTDVFYMSIDGVHFEKVSETYRDLTPDSTSDSQAEGSWEDGRTWSRWCFNCPSLIYHNGYFWMLANERDSGEDQTLRLVVSYSKDLVNWVDQKQVKVAMPGGWLSNGNPNQFDAVAADWAVAPSGDVYAVVSVGRYGDFHGQPENDEMYPYLVKITGLSAYNDPAVDLKNNWDCSIVTETAQPIVLPWTSNNRIDGSLFFDHDGTPYLCIKRDGIYNEIWQIGSLNAVSNPDAWTLVQENVWTGNEAPSLVRWGDTYCLYTDKISTWNNNEWGNSNGTFVQRALSPWGPWSYPMRMDAYNSAFVSQVRGDVGSNAWAYDGPRHGTVIRVTDPSAISVVMAARDRSGWSIRPTRAPYSDTPSSEWFIQDGSLSYMYENGIMQGSANGAGDRVFNPYANMSRAEVATILYRAATGNSGNAELQGASRFPDVNGSQWYAGNVQWAAENGIITGNSATGMFNPESPVTREDLALMLGRFAGYMSTGEATVPDAGDGKFNQKTDAASVHDYARPAVIWATANSIFSNSTINPLNNATRAEVAKMFRLTLENAIP